MDLTPNKALQCVVVTPERTVLEETVDFVALPLYDGELGILPGRAPLIGRLGYGELRTKRGGQEKRYYVEGGFAQVRADVVTVLTSRAVRAEEISVPAVEQRIEAAQRASAGGPDAATQLDRVTRGRAELRVARKAAAGV
jgi:F-type H+-transporting ATPase subunit epsilon